MNPRLVATRIRGSSNLAVDVTVYGNAAYIKHGGTENRDGDFGILDISDPESLDQTANFHGLPEIPGIFTTTVAGNYLYVVVYRGDLTHEEPLNTKQLYVYDLSADELAPVLLGTTSLLVDQSYNVSSLALEGDFAYATLHRSPHDAPSTLLVILNVSDRSHPFVNGYFSSDSFFQMTAIGVSNGIAYIADFEHGWDPSRRRGKGLLAVDVRDPVNPTLVGTLTTHGAVFGLTVAGTTVYLLDRGEGVIAVDVSDPPNPRRLGNWHSPAYIQSIDSQGNTVFLSDWWNGITALDVSDPRAPQLVGVHQTNTLPGWSGENGPVSMQNGFAYLAAGYKGLEVVDFSNPANPILAGGFQPEQPVPGDRAPWADGLVVKEDVLVLAGQRGSGGGEGMWTFDISDPGDPILGSFDPQWNWHHAWAITDDFLAIGVYKYGGWPGIIWDVSDPFNTVVLAGYYPDSLYLWGMDVFVEGNRIYVVDNDFGAAGNFSIHEIEHTPDGVGAPKVAELIVAQASGVAVQDGIAYVTGATQTGTSYGLPVFGPYGLWVFDTYVIPPTPIANLAAGALEFVHVDGPYVYAGGEKSAFVYDGPSLTVFQVASPGSGEADGDTDLFDFAGFQECFGRTGGPGFDRQCKPFDVDEDGDVDHADLRMFQGAMTGPM